MLLQSRWRRLATAGVDLLGRNVSQDGRHLGYDCGGARSGGASSLHGLPALRVLFTFGGWREGHEGPCDYRKRWIEDSGCKRRLTQFVHRCSERLAGLRDDGVIALDSVGPAGAGVGQAARSHGRRGATEGGKHAGLGFFV